MMRMTFLCVISRELLPFFFLPGNPYPFLLEQVTGTVIQRATFIYQNNVFSAFVYYKEEVSRPKRPGLAAFTRSMNIC
jgi:hypothetical protein